MWRIIVARKINRVLGGVVVTPWEIDNLDDCTIDTLLAWADDLPAYRAAEAQKEADAARWRTEHGFKR